LAIVECSEMLFLIFAPAPSTLFGLGRALTLVQSSRNTHLMYLPICEIKVDAPIEISKKNAISPSWVIELSA